ncbi:MAG: hypothetical protein PW734_06165 [Verrucomicrobium sp.]|nr:hypothetical protein [Verrucomicrobium sp.]
MTAPLRRQIVSQTRVLDAQQGLVEYVASDQTLDSYQEVVLAAGWKFSLFGKNAPFVDSHDYSSIERLLGRVVDFRVEGDKLVETVQWAHDVPENALARLGWKMTLAGHLRAVSVGFVPRRTLSKFDADPRPYQEQVRRLGMAERPPVRIYAEQEQIELSACLIGANPNALARAHAAGVLTDGDLESVGIGEEDAAFLHQACALLERAEEPHASRFRAGLAARLREQMRRHPLFRETGPGPAAENPKRPVRQSARREFLRALRATLRT